MRPRSQRWFDGDGCACCRVIVIVASVVVFKNPMSLQTKISTMVALAGVFAYSQAKRMTAKPAK